MWLRGTLEFQKMMSCTSWSFCLCCEIYLESIKPNARESRSICKTQKLQRFQTGRWELGSRWSWLERKLSNLRGPDCDIGRERPRPTSVEKGIIKIKPFEQTATDDNKNEPIMKCAQKTFCSDPPSQSLYNPVLKKDENLLRSTNNTLLIWIYFWQPHFFFSPPTQQLRKST